MPNWELATDGQTGPPEMLRWIIGSSLKFRFLVVLAAAVMIAVGLVRLREMPIDVFPEFAPPRVEI